MYKYWFKSSGPLKQLLNPLALAQLPAAAAAADGRGVDRNRNETEKEVIFGGGEEAGDGRYWWGQEKYLDRVILWV